MKARPAARMLPFSPFRLGDRSVDHGCPGRPRQVRFKVADHKNSGIVVGAAGLLRRNLHPGFDGKCFLPGIEGVEVLGPDGGGGCDVQNIKRAGACLSGVGRA